MLFSMKITIKESGTLCLWRNEVEGSVFIKTEGAFVKFCFWLSWVLQISPTKKFHFIFFKEDFFTKPVT